MIGWHIEAHAGPSNQPLCRPDREDPAEHHPHRRHRRQALSEQLAEELESRCPNRDAQAELALPRGVPCHQKHGHITARNRRHDTDHRHQ